MLAVNDATLLRGGRRVVDGVSLRVRPGRLLALVGPNGAGKSSVLALLAGRLRPDAGTATLDDRPLQQWTPRALARRRAVLSQQIALGFGFPALQVVLLGRSPHLGGAEPAYDRRIAIEALRQVGVAHLAARNYLELSGGEQRRVQLARVLAQVRDCRDTAYLLFDEPEAGLDIAHQHRLLALARRLAAQGLGIAVVLHDLNLAARYADDAAVLADGCLMRCGAADAALEPALLSAIYGLPLRRSRVEDRWMIVPA